MTGTKNSASNGCDNERPLDCSSISDAVRTVRAAAAELDSFLQEASVCDSMSDSRSIESELLHLGDCEDALRRELDALHLDFGDSDDASRTDSVIDMLKSAIEVPDMVLASPASSVSSSIAGKDGPPLPVLEFESCFEDFCSRKTKKVPQELLNKLRDIRCALDKREEMSRTMQQCEVESTRDEGKKGFVEHLADAFYGIKEYKVRPYFSRSSKRCIRTVQGTVSVAIATALCVSEVGRAPTLSSSILIPALISLLEVNIPHEIRETNIAAALLTSRLLVRQLTYSS